MVDQDRGMVVLVLSVSNCREADELSKPKTCAARTMARVTIAWQKNNDHLPPMSRVHMQTETCSEGSKVTTVPNSFSALSIPSSPGEYECSKENKLANRCHSNN